MRILIVEDETGVAQFIEQGLIEAGYVVDVASNGQDGLDYALEVDYDAIVLDILLPKMDGIQIILLLAGLGGYFLAGRALSPIQRITQTAQKISASDLSKRLNYQGPCDEIGLLTQTIDQMLPGWKMVLNASATLRAMQRANCAHL